MTPGFRITAQQGTYFRSFIDADKNGIPDHYETNQYTSLTWSEYVQNILGIQCNHEILISEQTSFHPLTPEKICFSYDFSGNYNRSDQCTTLGLTPFSDTQSEYMADELEILNTNIKIYPVPTSSILSVSWNENIVELVSHMKLIAANGGYEYSIPMNSSDHYTEIDLTYQVKGIYYLIISLKSGRSFSRSIIKI